jgi:antitoxin component YwqK of YwqJK toxin-antitoxin module
MRTGCRATLPDKQVMSPLGIHHGGPFFKVGVWKYYFENGNKKEEESFDEFGVRVGEWTLWYENGNKKETSHWKNSYKNSYGRSMQVGKHIFWYENGQKETEYNFVNGDRNCQQTSWYENGKIISRNSWINGKNIGTKLF